MNKLFTAILAIILILAVLYVTLAFIDIHRVSRECSRYGWDDSKAKTGGDDHDLCIMSRESDGVMIRRTLEWVKSHCDESGQCTE